MRTKRYISLLLAALMVLTLTACGAKNDKDKESKSDHAAISIYPAKFTPEEEALMDLLDIGMDNHRVFDFQMGSETTGVQSIRLRAYELAGNDWNCVSNTSSAFTDAIGRLALTFGKMPEGVRMSWQSENSNSSQSFSVPAVEGEDVSSLIYATSVLTDSPSVELDEEVPLVLQIATSKNEISSYQVDYFGMPRELAKHGYEHVYAITVTFSASSVADRSPDTPAEPSPTN